MLKRSLLPALLCLALPCHAAFATDDALDLHVLNRLALGPSAADLKDIRDRGVDPWIARQLHPETIPQPAWLTARLDQLETTKRTPVELFQEYGPPIRAGAKPDPVTVKGAREKARVILQQADEARLLRAIWSPRQLQEVMTDFWYNHFNVFAEKGLDHLWVGNYEEVALRPHAIGKFRDLLAATAHHPAMLFYLDNWRNFAPGSGGPKAKESGLNENYARELMELHTLGVDGGYSQDDVIALARILTGWGLGGRRQGGGADATVFNAQRHDFGTKQFLGHIIDGSGAGELDEALDILARSPATAHHLSYQLAQYFVADEPPKALVDRLTQRWIESDGDVRAVLAMLFSSPEFRNPANDGVKFKTPYQFIVSSVRAVGADVTNFQPLIGTLKRLGEPLYGCLTPDGYKNTAEAWLNPDALMLRVNYATALGAGHLLADRTPAPNGGETMAASTQSAVNPPPMPIDLVQVEALLNPILTDKTRNTIETAPLPMKTALLLGSPDFMRR